ncbi:MAG: dTMP kinase [Proteobacteria bacterium]|nr:dTMP kinase [Pseudomonadota bacterium]
MRGAFITFEGIEGSGKSTQIGMLAESLSAKGLDVVVTREPGGTQIGEQIRAVLLDASHRGMTPITELMLYAAARHQHVEEVIEPALAGGRTVLCDRYADATTAYQGAARRIDPSLIKAVHQVATGGLAPGLTVLLDLPARDGLARAIDRNARGGAVPGHDRFEREALEFHERVRDGYLSIAREEPDRIAVIDALGPVEEIHEKVLAAVEKFLHQSPVTSHQSLVTSH